MYKTEKVIMSLSLLAAILCVMAAITIWMTP